ncbi:P-loop containing nucleoside triphosphate hydrolase protein [Sarocladium strictum]
MEGQVQFLMVKAWRMYEYVPSDRRLILGIAGIPGSGKTTLAKVLTDRLNEHSLALHPSAPPPATFVPMDGFHLSRAELDQLPDPTLAHARRGAAFTFNATKFLSLIQALRKSPPALIRAPSFDHAVKDPVEDDIEILPSHRIVVVEGLYLTLDRDIWRDAAKLFDEVWFVDVFRETARKRLRERHVRAGIAETLEEGDRRAVENDLVNGDEIMQHRVRVDELLQSVEDDEWVHE